MSSPTTFGKYVLLERINVGGMAEVFKAKAFGVEGFERILAIKRILPNMADDDEFINMFVDEARIAVQLSHANVVQIYELGKFENQYYIAMEYVSGKDLRQILDRFRKKKQNFTTPAAAYLTAKICEGLDYAHRKTDPSSRPLNLIHRDVSPQNILVSYEGAVKITDFGIAKAEDRASKTQAGVLKGKFGYMSPEQVRGLEIDHRSDIFAVGILMYEMLTGKRLFIGESDFATLEKVRAAEVVPPREHNPDIPEELERVVLKALARERDDRYAWASDLHDDLQQFLIEENTIYNAKRLSQMLKEEFASDIEGEMQKMEEFMRMVPPQSAEAIEGARHMVNAPRRDNAAVASSERTMIFESGFAELANAPTQIGEELSVDHKTPVQGRDPDQRTGSFVSSSREAPRRQSALSSVSKPVVRLSPAQTRTRGPPLVAAALAALLVLAVGAYLAFGGGPRTGTLMVVISGAEGSLEIIVDDKKVGESSTLINETMPAGEHLVQVRAKGAEEKAYRVNIVPGQATYLSVALGAAGEAKSGEVVVSTDPMGASVIVEGQEKGTTPVTLPVPDVTRPISIVVQKDGYESQVLSATFGPNETRASASAILRPLDRRAGDRRATLDVQSEPPEATVYVDGRKRGVTPVIVSELDSRDFHELRVTKSGYRAKVERVSFEGTLSLQKSYQLEELDRLPGPSREPDRVPKPPKEKPSGGGASGGSAAGGGGSCGGDDAIISVNVHGETSCVVTVGGKKIGETPLFKRPSPSGRCEVRIVCAGSGKSYREVKVLKEGSPEKFIVKPEMLE